ncbi:hypothetical protein TELCIR_05812, partial [Teladorsagia circumcincta]
HLKEPVYDRGDDDGGSGDGHVALHALVCDVPAKTITIGFLTVKTPRIAMTSFATWSSKPEMESIKKFFRTIIRGEDVDYAQFESNPFLVFYLTNFALNVIFTVITVIAASLDLHRQLFGNIKYDLGWTAFQVIFTASQGLAIYVVMRCRKYVAAKIYWRQRNTEVIFTASQGLAIYVVMRCRKYVAAKIYWRQRNTEINSKNILEGKDERRQQKLNKNCISQQKQTTGLQKAILTIILVYQKQNLSNRQAYGLYIVAMDSDPGNGLALQKRLVLRPPVG